MNLTIVDCFEKNGVMVHRPRAFSKQEKQYLENLRTGCEKILHGLGSVALVREILLLAHMDSLPNG